MVSLTQLLLSAAVLAPSAHAHFTLTHPTPLLSLPSSQDEAPCGGIAPSFQKLTSYYVGGEAIALVSTHPQVNILIRATLDPDATGNWTNLFPVVKQSGIGSFCEPLVPVPAAWVGKKGIIQVIQSGVDGLLYQVGAVLWRFHFWGGRICGGEYCVNVVLTEMDLVRGGQLPRRDGGVDNDALQQLDGRDGRVLVGSEAAVRRSGVRAFGDEDGCGDGRHGGVEFGACSGDDDVAGLVAGVEGGGDGRAGRVYTIRSAAQLTLRDANQINNLNQMAVMCVCRFLLRRCSSDSASLRLRRRSRCCDGPGRERGGSGQVTG